MKINMPDLYELTVKRNDGSLTCKYYNLNEEKLATLFAELNAEGITKEQLTLIPQESFFNLAAPMTDKRK